MNLNHLISVLVSLSILLSLGAPAVQAHSPALPAKQAENQGWIAYLGADNNIWLVHPDGSGTKKVTSDGSSKSRYRAPKWSPDGQMLAFTLNESGFGSRRRGDIKVYSLASDTILHTITATGTNFDWLSASRLVYDKPATFTDNDRGCPTKLTSYDGLYVMDILTGTEETFLLAASGQPLFAPQLSPSGSSVILRFDQEQAMYGSGPYYVSELAEGSQPHALEGSWAACDWSPDSKTIACDSYENTQCNPGSGVSCPVILYSVSGAKLSTLAPSQDLYDLNPLWSPDGQSIAITASDGFSFADGPCFGGSGPITGGENSFVDILSAADRNKRSRLTSGVLQDWSPDGDYLLISRESSYHVVDSQTGEVRPAIAEGPEYAVEYSAVWQPGLEQQASVSPETLQEWVNRKEIAIEDLTNPNFDWVAGQENIGNYPAITTPDESGAIQLLTQFRSQQGDISLEKTEAFYRLVLQEEAIARVLGHYENISNDQGEWWTDFLIIALHSAKIFSGVRSSEWLEFLLEDVVKLVITHSTDPEQREIASKLADAVISYAMNDLDITSHAVDLGIESFVRASVTELNALWFALKVNSSIHQGVNSVLGEPDPVWEISGDPALAESTTKYLGNVSEEFAEAAHANYEDIRENLGVTKVIIDVTSLVGPLTWQLQLAARLPYLLTQMWQLVVNLDPAARCSVTMAQNAGKQSFNPDPNGVPECSFELLTGRLNSPSLQSSGYVDADAWNDYKASYSTILNDYAIQVGEIAEKITESRTLNANELKQLDAVLSQLEAVLSHGSALVTPPQGQSWDDQTLGLFQNMMQIKAQTALFLYILDIPESDLKAPEVQSTLTQSLTDLLTAINQNQAAIEKAVFEGEPAGIGLVEPLSNFLVASPGTTVEIPFKLVNIGSGILEPGHLLVRMVGSETEVNLETPAIESGQEILSTVRISVPETLPALVVLDYTANERTATQRIHIVEQAQIQLDQGKGSNFPLILAGGVLVLIGGLVVITAGFFFLVRRKKNGQQQS